MASGCGRKKRRRCKPRPACCRKGRVSNNPFLNFLRCFRIRHCNWSATKIAIEGARAWCRMSKCQRRKFYEQARKKSCAKGPLVVPPPCCKKSSKVRRSRKGKKSCGRKKQRRSGGRRACGCRK